MMRTTRRSALEGPHTRRVTYTIPYEHFCPLRNRRVHRHRHLILLRIEYKVRRRYYICPPIPLQRVRYPPYPRSPPIGRQVHPPQIATRSLSTDLTQPRRDDLYMRETVPSKLLWILIDRRVESVDNTRVGVDTKILRVDAS